MSSAAQCIFPNWPGLEDVYQAQILHSSFWPADCIDMSRRTVTVVGTDAMGLQLSPEITLGADKLT